MVGPREQVIVAGLFVCLWLPLFSDWTASVFATNSLAISYPSLSQELIFTLRPDLNL